MIRQVIQTLEALLNSLAQWEATVKFNNKYNSCQYNKECYRIRSIYSCDIREALLNSDNNTTQNQINQECSILRAYINNIEYNVLIDMAAEISAISQKFI